MKIYLLENPHTGFKDKETGYVWGILLHGCEICTMPLWEREEDTIEGFDIWMWTKVKSIKWIDRVSSEELLMRIKENGKLLDTIWEGNWM